MNKTEQFFDLIRQEMTLILATADGTGVTMRTVSPVYFEGGILIFTSPASRKYRQLEANSHCCIAVGEFFAECAAEFLGATMLDENSALRQAYAQKFPDAFDEGVAFGGRAAEFILLKPRKLTGWGFENNAPSPDGAPPLPFEIMLG